MKSMKFMTILNVEIVIADNHNTRTTEVCMFRIAPFLDIWLFRQFKIEIFESR